MANFSYLLFELSVVGACQVKPEQDFRPIGQLNRFIQLRLSKVKYKYSFYEV